MSSYLRDWPIFEFIGWLFVTVLYRLIWRRYPSEEADPNERSLGVTLLTGQINALLASGTLVFGFIGAMGALLIGDEVNMTVKTHLFWGFVAACLSTVSALFASGVMTTYVKRHNVAYHIQVVILVVSSLFFLMCALARTMLGASSLFWPS